MQDYNKEIWVFVEQHNGKVADVSLELLSKANKLSNQIDGYVKAVIIGYNISDLVDLVAQYGAAEAIVIDDKKLENYLTLPYTRILNELISIHKPRIVLFGATIIGRDLAPRVASYTKSGLTADCTELKIDTVTYLGKKYENLLLQIRPAFGGNIIATIITPDTETQMATVREGVMQMVKQDKTENIKVTNIDYIYNDFDSLIEIIEQHREENKVNLKGAPIIVAGGYGLGSKENFRLLEELAHVIGGEVAGSRAAVDAGFVPPERQVGQTGVTVRPKLYIAIGISGAIQHRAGMQESNKIIAINIDPDAPIFEVAHYGIVGDAAEIIPMLIETYKQKLK